MSELVTVRHLDRKAVIYIRQSTPQQVLSNQESLRLQYALRRRAQDLGWHEADIEAPPRPRRAAARSVWRGGMANTDRWHDWRNPMRVHSFTAAPAPVAPPTPAAS
jgi:hypothetical protein